jgi:hypothetical protein
MSSETVDILLAGGTKKQQNRGIGAAQQFWAEYLDEQGEG